METASRQRRSPFRELLPATPEPTRRHADADARPFHAEHMFAADQIRSFAIVSTDVGNVTGVCIRHDNSGPEPDWFVSEVRIDGGAGFVSFTFNRWLAADKADGMLEACRGTATSLLEGGRLPQARASVGQERALYLLAPTPTPVPTIPIGLIQEIYQAQPRFVFPLLPLARRTRSRSPRVTPRAPHQPPRFRSRSRAALARQDWFPVE